MIYIKGIAICMSNVSPAGTVTVGNTVVATGTLGNPEEPGSVTDAPGSVTDASGNVTDVSGSVTDASGRVTDASGSVTDAPGSVIDASGSVTDASGSVTDVSGSVTDASGSVTDASGKLGFSDSVMDESDVTELSGVVTGMLVPPKAVDPAKRKVHKKNPINSRSNSSGSCQGWSKISSSSSRGNGGSSDNSSESCST